MTNMDEEEEKRRAAVEKRAYEIYESRGSSHGMDADDWRQAEHEINGAPASDALPDDDDDIEVEESKGAA